jgi:LmbE family N-acetylglucosaminyl deacetylase
MEERLLIVFPHPDDEAYGAAGISRKLDKKERPLHMPVLR